MANPLSRREGARGVNTLTSLLCSPGSCHRFLLADPSWKPDGGAWPAQSREVSLQWGAKDGEYIWRVRLEIARTEVSVSYHLCVYIPRKTIREIIA